MGLVLQGSFDSFERKTDIDLRKAAIKKGKPDPVSGLGDLTDPLVASSIIISYAILYYLLTIYIDFRINSGYKGQDMMEATHVPK